MEKPTETLGSTNRKIPIGTPSSSTSSKNKVVEMIEPKMSAKASVDSQNELILLNEEENGLKMPTLPSIPAFGSRRAMSRVEVIPESDKTDYPLLQKRMSEKHPRNKYGKKYTCSEACFDFHTGYHGVFDTSQESDLDKFGLGMTLYFRFLKFITFFFFLFTLLSIPSLLFAIKASENFGVNGLTDYKGMLYFTTIGSIGRGSTNCAQAKIGDNVTFSCVKGVLGKNLQYGRILSNQDVSCELFSLFSWDDHCNNGNTAALNSAYDACRGQATCNIVIDEGFFNFGKSGCASYSPDVNADTTFYFRAICDDIELDFNTGSPLTKETIGYIITSFDAAICVLYIIMLVMLKDMEKKTGGYLEANINSVDGYTIKVSNLPEKNREELRRDLWKHFSQINEDGRQIEYNVVDVQIAESQYSLDLQIRLAVIRKKKVALYRRFYSKWAGRSDTKLRHLTYEDIQRLAREGNSKKLREFKPIRKLKERQERLKKRLQHETRGRRSTVVAAYVTFETKAQRDEIHRRYHKSPLNRFCYSFCECWFKDDLNVFHDTYLKVKEAPAPCDILWANLDIEQSEKFLRRLVSWFITIGLWAVSFAFIVFAKSETEQDSSVVRPTQSCAGYGDLTESLVREDARKGDQSLGLTECFCRNNWERELFNSLCTEWTLERLKTNALPFLVVAGIIVTNYALQYVFKVLSRFERYQSKSTECTARVIKIFVAQMLNTGVIILVVNAKFTRSPPVSFLSGNYDDLIPEWYLNVGTTLLTTMIINIVNLPLVNSLSYFFKGCFRCCDRNCTCDETQTCKETQEEWEKLYTGPEFLVDFRYAQILTVIFICFFYSSGLPLLYITTFLNLLAVYWMDKIFLLRVCRLPRMFDDKLEAVVRRTLYAALALHLVFGVWTYGCPQIFGNEASFDDVMKLVDEYNNMNFRYFIVSLWKRAWQGQNIVLSLLFCGLAVTVIAIVFFRQTISRMANFCFGKHKMRIGDETRYNNQKTYYDCVQLDDLIMEQKYLEREIVETVDEQLKTLLARRLERVQQEIDKRDPEEENHLKKFIGIFSYFVGHNPVYKPFYDTKGLQMITLDSEKVSIKEQSGQIVL